MPRPHIQLDTTGSRDGFERLSPDLQDAAGFRLVGAALVYGGCWIAMYVANWIQFAISSGAAMPGGVWARRTLLAILLSAAVIAVVKLGKVSGRNFVRVAFVFQVLGALLIVQELWQWQIKLNDDLTRLATTYGADVTGFLEESFTTALREDFRDQGRHPCEIFRYDGINAVVVWLLIFPLIVPVVPGRALFQSLVTASTVPALAYGSVWQYGMPELLGPLGNSYLFDMIMPVYVIAGAAAFGSHVVYGLTRELAEARELGSYRLLEKIGQGGMGEVWRAQHRLLARPAAVKLIQAGSGSSATESTARSTQSTSAVRRFEREAQATAALNSPHTIHVYDFGIADDGTFYYVMEYLSGLDLKTLIEKFGPVSDGRTAHILRQAAHSLWDAHASGLIHRDVKPGNLFLGVRGPDYDFVKVLDFGLVKHVEEATADARTQLTLDGTISGTPSFLAPECATGKAADARSDLYSLGCVAYWLLTGTLVFEDSSPVGLMIKHVNEPPPPPSTRTELPIDPGLEALVMQLLAKSPDDRIDSAAELVGRLDELIAGGCTWSQDQAERWWSVHRPESPSPEPASV